jgi:hypothetical protein
LGRFTLSYKIEMNGPKNTDFADRLSAAANAKKAQLERAARARSAAESPAVVERRSARDAVRVARDARIAERTATKLAIEAQQAAIAGPLARFQGGLTSGSLGGLCGGQGNSLNLLARWGMRARSVDHIHSRGPV